MWQTERQLSSWIQLQDSKFHGGIFRMLWSSSATQLTVIIIHVKQILKHYTCTHCALVWGPAFGKLPCDDHCGLGGPLDSEILWNVCWVDTFKKKNKECISEWNILRSERKGNKWRTLFCFLFCMFVFFFLKLFFPCNVLLGRKVSVTVSCDWLWEGQCHWLRHTARKTHGQQTHGAQGCTYWLATVGSANPAYYNLWTTSIWRLTTDPCGPSANWSFTSTKSGLALPAWCHVGIETNPKHSMRTVLCGTSVGCHATSCPVKDRGMGRGVEALGEEGS